MTKIMKKLLSLALACIMVAQLSTPVFAEVEDVVTTATPASMILTDASITLDDDPVEDIEGPVDLTSVVKILFALKATGDVLNGEVYRIKVPESVSMENVILHGTPSYDLALDSDTHEIVITFIENEEGIALKQEDILDINFVSGFIIVEESTVNEVTISIPINEDETKEYKILLKPRNIPSSIKKIGIPDRSYNPSKAKWEVTFNMYQEEINKATVIDSFDKTKMDLIADLVKLYPAQRDTKRSLQLYQR